MLSLVYASLGIDAGRFGWLGWEGEGSRYLGSRYGMSVWGGCGGGLVGLDRWGDVGDSHWWWE